MNWLDQHLNGKFVVGSAAGLLTSTLVFLGLFFHLYHGELKKQRAETARQVNQLLQTSLENAMLKRDLEGLRTILARLGEQQDILSVMISNPAGEVRFASHPSALGAVLRPAGQSDIRATTRFIRDSAGREVLRSIKPVANKPACAQCHGAAEPNPINGVLYVDYAAAPMRRQARATTLLLMGSGAVIVLINLVGGWWFVRRYILRPVSQLTAASRQLAGGDLDTRIHLSSRDELAQLGDTFNTMAERLQTKMRELREKEQFLQQLVDAIPDGVRIIDQQYRVVLANRACREQLKCSNPSDSQPPCHAQAHQRDAPCPDTLLTCPIKEIQLNPEPLKVIHQHTRCDGSLLDVEIYAAPMRVTRDGQPALYAVESIRDLEQEVRFSHEHKLSELGRLAAGVAHEIHNPLASVRLALHATRQENSATHPERGLIAEGLGLIDQEIDKCIQVTGRLLKLSMPPPSQPELVELDHSVDGILRLLHWDAENQRVIVTFHAEQPPLRILASDSEVRMIMLNLAQNALHAMPNGGELRVTCDRDGGQVTLSVTDTGTGIAREDLQRIFNPFFSRRADGIRGTGLGLSITKAIVENHGGSIEVDSQKGLGSAFIVRFPDADLEPKD